MDIAIVGTGVAGLVAARRLHERHRIRVFEAADHVGGHAWTLDVDTAGGTAAVDVGFMVYNEVTYPILTRLFHELAVRTRPTEMSFSVQCRASGIEWCGSDLAAVFAWKRNALRPRFVRMLLDVLRFNREAPRDLADGIVEPTLAAYLASRGYSQAFADWYVVPMAAAIWSTAPGRVLDAPSEFLLRFLHNHGLLSVDGHLRWRTVVGGSRRYVEAIARPFADRIHARTPVRGVRRTADGVAIETDAGTARFDHVVLACHADQALALLRDPSEFERDILGALPYQRNEAVVHTDAAVLPRRPRARASWNVHRTGASDAPVAVTYDLTRLQGLATGEPVLLTLNAPELVDPTRVVRRLSFDHPVFTPAGERAKQRYGEIAGVRRTSYCGAYWRNGFHEDGAWSAERAVAPLRSAAAVRTVA